MRNTVIKHMLVLIAAIMVASLAASFPASAYAQGPVARIGSTLYYDIQTAIDAAPMGNHNETIIHLLTDIDHNDTINVLERKIIFDLNGKKLNVHSGNYVGINVTSGEVRLLDPDDGEFNVSNESVYTYEMGESAVLLSSSYAEVTNIRSPSIGVTLSNSSIKVFGDITITAGSTYSIGIFARYYSHVIVEGAIHAPINPATWHYIVFHSYAYEHSEFIDIGARVFDPSMPEYWKYTDGDNTVWVRGEPVCEIVGQRDYISLYAAIDAVPDYDNNPWNARTIRLLTDINSSGFIVNNKKITFDLNGKSLNVVAPYGYAFLATNGSDVRLLNPANGEFNVTVIDAYDSRCVVCVARNSYAEVTNVTTDYDIAVELWENSMITVYGDITVTTAQSGIEAQQGSRAVVEGVIYVPNMLTKYVTFLNDNSNWENKGIYDYEMDASMPGYRKYTDGHGAIWVKGDLAFVIVETGMPHTSLIATLKDVYNNMPGPGNVTIKLLQDYTHTGNLTQYGNVLYEKHFTFDLNGHTLEINRRYGIGLHIESGSLKLANHGNGQFNIIGESGLAVGEASIEVTNVTATSADGYGVRVYWAGNPSEAVVHGEIASAGDYIWIQNTPVSKKSGMSDDARPGYLRYGRYEDELIVWVRDEAVTPVVLDHIEIRTLPNKRNYIVGETLDITGLSVYAVYSDGTDRRLVYDNGSGIILRDNYTASPADGAVLNIVGTQFVTVSHGGKTAAFKITVTGSMPPKVINFSELTGVIKGYGDSADDVIVFIEEGFLLSSGLIVPINNNGATLTIMSANPDITLTRNFDGVMFTVSDGAKLIFEDIIIDGNKEKFPYNFNAIVHVLGGEFIVNDGTVLKNNHGPGVAVTDHGRFTMNGGEITGNTYYGGSGVLLTSSSFTNITGGTFIMTGGKISGNAAYSIENTIDRFGGSGSGVTVSNNSVFIMTGGEISGNSAEFVGGGVYVDYAAALSLPGGKFTMTGGVITGNTADIGGGVYVDHGNEFILGGTAAIRGNINDNVYLASGQYITPGISANIPAPGMEVWVTKPGDNGVIVAAGASPGDEAYFFADERGKDVVYDDSRLRIDLPTTPIRYGDVNDDGIVDELDVVLMERHLARWPISINEAAADLNGDGVVDEMDIVVLERHLARWPGYETLPIKP